jgi:hypothetical protein
MPFLLTLVGFQRLYCPAACAGYQLLFPSKGTGRGCVVEPPLGKGFKDEPLRTAESGGGFSLPLLTVYILSQVGLFVKPFLKFFCLVLPSRFQRLAVAFLALGSHLYPAQQDSARQGSWGKVLPTLVGQPVTLRLPHPHPLCLDYSTLGTICQALFLFFLGWAPEDYSSGFRRYSCMASHSASWTSQYSDIFCASLSLFLALL